MSYFCKVHSQAANTSTGNQSLGITLAGVPKWALVWATKQTADGLANGLDFSLGLWYAGASAKCCEIAADDAAAAAAVESNDTTKLVNLTRGANDLVISPVSFSTTPTWNVDTASSAYILNFLFGGGSDVTDVWLIEGDTPTSASTVDYTSSGKGTPDFALMLSIGGTAAGATLTDLMLGIGMLDGNGGAACAAISSQGSADPTNTNKYQRGTLPFALVFNDAKVVEATSGSLITDGVRLTFGTADASARKVWFLCIKGGRYKVFAETQKTSTGTKDTTGIVFTPLAEFLAGKNATVGTGVQGDAQLVVGASSGAGVEACCAVIDEDGAATSDTYSSVSQTKVIQHRNPGTGALQAEADLSAFAADTITHDWTTADATARGFIGFAVGEAAPPVTAYPWHYYQQMSAA